MIDMSMTGDDDEKAVNPCSTKSLGSTNVACDIDISKLMTLYSSYSTNTRAGAFHIGSFVAS
jgi:hypothetical protein